MGTQTQQDKAGNKYEVKPQYEKLSKQLQGIRHAYVTTSIDSSRDKDSTHLLISFTNASAESSSQRSTHVDYTCRFLDRSHATRNVCQQQHQIRNLKPAGLIASC
ncbi:hypothetical protein F511_43827 [Dorcoceras hygrometricum]|uniref:Uncharacterized protein n=1 Tax=Dorcoceras hygrometricum TaxID=472368 RepID=A0A2Z6ZYY5_9LAMI|nr:hypothetical protein F511_43827 [Dorcoceras hygrometricum]